MTWRSLLEASSILLLKGGKVHEGGDRMPGKVDQTALQLLLDGEVTATVDGISVLGGGQHFLSGTSSSAVERRRDKKRGGTPRRSSFISAPMKTDRDHEQRPEN